MKLSFSIVVPFYNEEDNINFFLDEIINVISRNMIFYSFEIICVDDGSTDSTGVILNEYKLKTDLLTVLNFSENKGQSRAIHYGIQNAIYENIITIDGDCQNDPNDIDKLLIIFKNNKKLSLVAGERIKRKDIAIKRISSVLANYFRNLILKDGCKDTGCSLKVFKKNIFLEAPFFDGIHRFIPAIFVGFGNNVKYVKVNHRPRLKGKSKYGISNRLFKGLRDIFLVKKIIQNKLN